MVWLSALLILPGAIDCLVLYLVTLVVAGFFRMEEVVPCG